MKKVPTEVYSRVCGYYRPVKDWNEGKKEEFAQRTPYDLQDRPRPAIVIFGLQNCPACATVKESLLVQQIPFVWRDCGTQGGLEELKKYIRLHRADIRREEGEIVMPLVFEHDATTGESVLIGQGMPEKEM